MHTRQRAIERSFVKTVTRDDLCGRATRLDSLGLPGNTSHGTAALFEMSKKAAADVASGTGEENIGLHMTHLLFRS